MWKTKFIQEDRPSDFSREICHYKNTFDECQITILNHNKAYVIYKEVDNGRKTIEPTVSIEADSRNKGKRKPRKTRG